MKEGKSLLAGKEVTGEGQEGSVIITALEAPTRRGSAETWRGKALATVFPGAKRFVNCVKLWHSILTGP